MTSQMEVMEVKPTSGPREVDPADKARIGRVVATLRQERNLSQLTLAKALGVSRSHLCNIEAGRNRPTARQLGALAGALNTSVESILDGHHAIAANMGDGKTACPFGCARADLLLLACIKKLSASVRDRLTDEVIAQMMQEAQTRR